MKTIDLKNILRQWRLRENMTQNQVAKLLRVKRNTYQAWEAGRASPSISQIIQLCEIYRADSIDEFLCVSRRQAVSELENRYRRLSRKEKSIVDFILQLPPDLCA